MKIKTTDLTGPALDWAVAQADAVTSAYVAREGEWVAETHVRYFNPEVADDYTYAPSYDWAQGGPIIERIKPQLTYQTSGKHAGQWGCNIWHTNKQGALCPGTQYGPTYLIAAMRCYVASKLGDKIEIPEELL